MLNQEHLKLLKQDVSIWNIWRKENKDVIPDLEGADLSGVDLSGKDLRLLNLSGADLSDANLSSANLSGADLYHADLRKANLTGANLSGVDLGDVNLSEANLSAANFSGVGLQGLNLRFLNLSGADLSEADLSGVNLSRIDLRTVKLQGANLYRANLNGANLGRIYFYRVNLGGANLSGAYLRGTDLIEANLRGANLVEADLTKANLCGANLSGAILTRANLTQANLSQADLKWAELTGAIAIQKIFNNADLTGCLVYGISAWDVQLKETKQFDLVITPKSPNQPIITVDSLKVAQFIYLLLNNQEIREVIDTITSKVVLILGRFTEKRKAVLYAISNDLRNQNYLPVIFDFQKPDSQDFIETVSTLAHMARFVIADFTDPKVVLEEVPHIVRNIAVPVVPLLMEGSGKEPVTLSNLRINHRSLLDTFCYRDLDDLLANLYGKIIAPAEEKVKELRN